MRQANPPQGQDVIDGAQVRSDHTLYILVLQRQDLLISRVRHSIPSPSKALCCRSNFTQVHAQLNMTKLNDHTHRYSLEMPFMLMLLEGNTKTPKIFHVKPKRVSIDAHQAHQVKQFDQVHQGHQAHQAGS